MILNGGIFMNDLIFLIVMGAAAIIGVMGDYIKTGILFPNDPNRIKGLKVAIFSLVAAFLCFFILIIILCISTELVHLRWII